MIDKLGIVDYQSY